MQEGFPRKDEKQKDRKKKRKVAGFGTCEEGAGEEAKKKITCFAVTSKTKGKGGGGKSVSGGEGIVADAGGLEEVSVTGGEKPHPEPGGAGLRPTFAKKAVKEAWKEKKGEVVEEKEEAIGVE